MRKLITLTRILLKSGLGMTPATKNLNGKSKKASSFAGKQGFVIVILLVCFIPIIKSLYDLGQTLYLSFAQIGLPELPIQVIGFMGSFVILFFAIPYVLSVFFLASDLETLLPLPIKPWQIVAAKFIAILVYEYLMLFLFIIPPFVGYGIASSSGILFWLFLIIILILLPIVPLIYASLLGILMMRILKNMKNKEMLTTLGSVLLIFVIMGFNFFINSNRGSTAQLTDIIVQNQHLLEKITIFFPNLYFTSGALAHLNILSLLLFILIVAAFAAVFLFIAEKFYLGGVLGMSEVTSKHRKMTQKEKAIFTHKRDPVTTYALKEFKTLLRTPIYFMNCMLTPLIMPLIMIFLIGLSSMSNSNMSGAGALFSNLINSIPTEVLTAILLVVIFGLTIMVGSSNLTTSTCISREGQNYFFMKYIPMSYKDQLRAKLLNGLFISIAVMLPYTLIGVPAAIILLHLNPLVFLLCLAINILTLLLVNYAQLWSDLSYPKLIWESEQSAVKQNFAATITLFGVMILGFLIGAGLFICYTRFHIPVLLLAVFYILLIGIIIIPIRKAVYAYGARKLEDLES